ncbi:MAG: tetratricopeptide repeat protein [Anaerolineae bacterium]|nr:tetratricopeptide repeat protein [Anaerolineae bacterium]
MATTGLPVQLTTFIGRERDLAAVEHLLSTARLVTLTGVGGSGKTRLAVELTKKVRAGVQDDVIFVDLAPLRESELVPQLIAQTLGLRLTTDQPPLDALLDFLRPKQLLIVLDNCEHLITACTQLAHHLLLHADEQRLLATSREPLGLVGEAVYPLSGLAVPDVRGAAAGNFEPQTLLQYDAVRLFTERARLIAPDFSLTPQNTAAVAEICRRLDGLPLALELASARANVLTAQDIAARLDNRFALLTTRLAGRPTRHQTLRATMEWSYTLLTAEEQTLLRRLAVFAGGWTLATATAVCAGDGLEAGRTLGLLSSLVDKSLVIADTVGHAQARYRLLDTIRDYALEKLGEAGETVRLCDRHLALFLALAQEAEPKLRGPEQTTWFERLDVERDNLRAALRWAATQAPDLGARACWALGWYWLRRGLFSEGRQWTETMLAGLPDGSADVADDVRRAQALVVRGMMGIYQSDGPLARASLKEAVSRFRAVGDKRCLAIALAWLGLASALQMDGAAQRLAAHESIALSRELNDLWWLAWALVSAASPTSYLDDLATVEARVRESQAHFTQVGDPWGVAYSHVALAGICLNRGDYTGVREWGDKCLPLLKDLGDEANANLALSFMAPAASLEGDHDRARQLSEECLPLSTRLGAQWSLASALRSLGWAERAEGHLKPAADYLGRALQMYRQMDNLPEASVALADLATLAALAGDEPTAARLARVAQAQYARLVIQGSVYQQEVYTTDMTFLRRRDVAPSCTAYPSSRRRSSRRWRWR